MNDINILGKGYVFTASFQGMLHDSNSPWKFHIMAYYYSLPQLYLISIPRLYSKKIWRELSALNLWNPGCSACDSYEKTKIF